MHFVWRLAILPMVGLAPWVSFARNPNRVLSREKLLDLVHSHDAEPFDRSIDVCVAQVRCKVERDPEKPLLIQTIPGAGYMFVPSKP